MLGFKDILLYEVGRKLGRILSVLPRGMPKKQKQE